MAEAVRAAATRFAFALLIGLCHAGAATARPPAGPPPGPPWDGALCEAAIARTEKSARTPPQLLTAIGVVESGRAEPRTARVTPWPWSINVGGQGRIFETRADAVAAVQALQAAGTQSIDVGCMQVNLMYHPEAFASIDQAFEPDANVVYAAGFLGRLFVQVGDWRRAAAAYHSQTPGLSEDYARRVIASWPLAARYGYFPTDDAAPLRPVEAAADPLARFAPTVTPEFRQRLAQAAKDRAHLVALGMLPAAPAHPAGVRLASLRVGRRG